MRARALLCALALAGAASAQQAAPDPATRIEAQPAGGEPVAASSEWGTLGDMVEPVWVTEGLPVERTTVSAWTVPGRVLTLRHGSSARMKLGTRNADIVQRVERDPATATFRITYAYEDGRKLTATGRIEPDGSFAELLTAADGTPQRNLYLLDSPRKMRIVRQKRTATGWVTTSTAVKLGETPAERTAREDSERREREAVAAAEEAKRRAEEAQRQAEEDAFEAELAAEREADELESQAQQQRNWANFQSTLRGIVQKQRDDIADSQRFQQRLRDTVAQAQAERDRRQAEADRAAAEARRAREQQVQLAQNTRNTQVQAQADRARQQAEAQRQAQAERQRQTQALAQQAQRQQQAQAAQQQADQARLERQRAAEAKAREASAPVIWKEGVVLCEPPKSGSGDWACHGPLQTTWGQPEKPSGVTAIKQACGGYDPPRELGQSSGFRIYGCGWGQNPAGADARDPSVRFGVFVPGRRTFTCPKNHSGVCRSN